MAYQITRKNRIKEELQLCNEDGSVALSVQVDLNTDEMGLAAAKAWERLGIATVAAQKDPEAAETEQAYGDAVLALFAVIFGEEQTNKILKFYEDRLAEMLLDLAPFVEDEIMPKVEAAREARKAQFLALGRRGGTRDAGGSGKNRVAAKKRA